MAENQTEIGEYIDGIVFNDLEHEFRDNSVTQLREDLMAEATARGNADTALSGRIDDVSEAVSAEVTARTNADTLLSGRLTSVDNRLSAEATARENADTALSNDITAEATARANADTALGNDITAEATARANADTALGNDITAEATARVNADTTLSNKVTAIEAVIPSEATANNQLADKNFVNSSIATNTANFLGTYSSLADIEAIQNPTNNDYAFLETTDAQGNNVYDRYKYSASDDEWLFEYELNNSSFTSGQWATINSGLTQNSVDTDIATAIGALDANQAGGNGKYIKAISEADGVISATEGTIDSVVTASSDNPVSSDAVKTYVDTQVTQAIAQVLNTGF